MSDDDKPQKISIGFEGGPGVSARVSPPDLSSLRKALGSTGFYDLKTEDGTIALALDKIVYVVVDAEGHRVGFGS